MSPERYQRPTMPTQTNPPIGPKMTLFVSIFSTAKDSIFEHLNKCIFVTLFVTPRSLFCNPTQTCRKTRRPQHVQPNHPAQRLGGFIVYPHFSDVINTRASGARLLNTPDVGWSGNGLTQLQQTVPQLLCAWFLRGLKTVERASFALVASDKRISLQELN